MKKMVFAAVAVVVVMVLSVAGYREHLIGKLRQQVLAELNDPLSAQFRNERFFSDWTADGSAMCGEVNAKNRMGGYVGFRTFTALPGYVKIDSESSMATLKELKLPACSFENIAPWWHLR